MQIIFFVIFYCAMAHSLWQAEIMAIVAEDSTRRTRTRRGGGHGRPDYGLPRSSSYLTKFRKFIPYTKKTAGMHEKLMRRMYGIKN